MKKDPVLPPYLVAVNKIEQGVCSCTTRFLGR